MSSISVHRTVEFADTDASGRIHFTAALRWAEQAEHLLLRRIGISAVSNLPRVAVEAQYLSPLRFGDQVRVSVRALNRGRSSLTFAWSISSSGMICVEGAHTVVLVDDDGRPRTISGSELDRIDISTD